MAVCPNCGASIAGAGRFCASCGTPLAQTPTPSRVRKTVTVLFADVVGSTTIGHLYDPETVRSVMSRYFDEMRAIVERHGGSVEKFIGDAVMAIFGIPRVREDDALRAVRAAVEMRGALERLNPEFETRWGVGLGIRIGVNTGQVVAGDASVGQTLVTGDTVNVTARLEQAAEPGEILLGELTHRLTRDEVRAEPVPPLILKGKPEPVSGFRLLGLGPKQSVGRARHEGRLVAREEELAELQDAFKRSRDRRSCELVTIVGSAGVGKTRLVTEFLSRLGPAALVLEGRCLSYGEGITYWPIVEIVRQASGAGETDPPQAVIRLISARLPNEPDSPLVIRRLACLLGALDDRVGADDVSWAVRRLIEGLGLLGPVVLVIEDIHWAEPTLLELIQDLAERTNSSLLLLCPARSELLADRPDWDLRPFTTTVRLEPLGSEAAEQMLERVLGSPSPGTAGIRTQIVSSAQGNPLFLEELSALLIDKGFVRESADGWVLARELGELEIPPTIEAVLASRLDRLEEEERTLIECASVVGLEFDRAAIAHLATLPDNALFDLHLQALTRRDLIVADAAEASPAMFRFRHVLIAEAAYRAMTRETRARLHERFGDWMESSFASRASEFDEILGYHLEQAFLHLSALGPADERARAIGARAATRLARAGRRALARYDMHAAANLLNRSVALVATDDAARPGILQDLGRALTEDADFVAASDALIRAVEAARALGDRVIEVRAEVAQSRLRGILGAEYSASTEADRASRWISVLEDLGDDLGLARAWRLMGSIEWGRCQVAAAERCLSRAISHARAANATWEVVEITVTLVSCMLEGPRPVVEAIPACLDIVAESEEEPWLLGFALVHLGPLEAMTGDFDTARNSYRRGRAIVEEIGRSVYVAATSQRGAFIEMLASDPVAAEAMLRPDCESLERLGEGNFLATSAAQLALALCAQGRFDEAEPFVDTSRMVGSRDDLATQIDWRRASARILSAREDLAAAERAARHAVQLASGTDQISGHADCLMDLAEILRVGHRPEEATAAAERALNLYLAKGNVVSAVAARTFLS